MSSQILQGRTERIPRKQRKGKRKPSSAKMNLHCMPSVPKESGGNSSSTKKKGFNLQYNAQRPPLSLHRVLHGRKEHARRGPRQRTSGGATPRARACASPKATPAFPSAVSVNTMKIPQEEPKPP